MTNPWRFTEAGTSNPVFFLEDDLPKDAKKRDAVGLAKPKRVVFGEIYSTCGSTVTARRLIRAITSEASQWLSTNLRMDANSIGRKRAVHLFIRVSTIEESSWP
jgi:hypothetical protein